MQHDVIPMSHLAAPKGPISFSNDINGLVNRSILFLGVNVVIGSPMPHIPILNIYSVCRLSRKHSQFSKAQSGQMGSAPSPWSFERLQLLPVMFRLGCNDSGTLAVTLNFCESNS